MKRKAGVKDGGEDVKDAETRDDGEEDEDLSQSVLKFCEGAAGGDVCKAVMDRYAKSSTAHHRHLCASAAAIRSILQDEGLPITPPAYFAAVVTAIRDAAADDPDAAAAFAAFLSIILPLVSAHSLPTAKAKDAAFVLVSFLKDRAGKCATGTIRSVVKSLGALVLLMDLDDWGDIQLPFETLLLFTVDRRPKVRRCAQIYFEKVFKILKSSKIVKKASKTVLSMYRKYFPFEQELVLTELSDATENEVQPRHEHLETIQMLILLRIIVPHLSEKVRMNILSDVHKILGGDFSLLTRPALGLIQELVEQMEAELLVSESENYVSTLSSYVSSSKKNPHDTILSALKLLKSYLDKLHVAKPTIWTCSLPIMVMSVKGYLCSDDNISKDVAEILKELITFHIDRRVFLATSSQSYNTEMDMTPESDAIVSLCSVFNAMLGDAPATFMLSVISALFIQLGEVSYVFMKDILLRLSEWARIKIDEDSTTLNHLQECIGCAVFAMGPEKVLSQIPISFDVDKLTISNAWLIPVLRRHVVGASLQLFIEHIVPLAQSILNSCAKVKKVTLRNHLQSYARELWGLLPAFCRFPVDTFRSFECLARQLIVILKEDPSLVQTISISLQDIVNQNRSVLEANEGANQLSDLLSGPLTKNPFPDFQSFPILYSKKTALKNIKALASNSMDLIQTLADVLFISPPENCTDLKSGRNHFQRDTILSKKVKQERRKE